MRCKYPSYLVPYLSKIVIHTNFEVQQHFMVSWIFEVRTLPLILSRINYLLPFLQMNFVAAWQYCHNHLARGEHDDSFSKLYRVKSPKYRTDWNIFPFLVRKSIVQLIRDRQFGHGYIYQLNTTFGKTPPSGRFLPNTTNIWGWSLHMSNRICNNWTFAPSFRAKRFNIMWYFDKAEIFIVKFLYGKKYRPLTEERMCKCFGSDEHQCLNKYIQCIWIIVFIILVFILFMVFYVFTIL